MLRVIETRSLPSIGRLEPERVERYAYSLVRLRVEVVQADAIGRVVLRIVGREQFALLGRSRAVEVVRTRRLPSTTAAHHLKLACVGAYKQMQMFIRPHRSKSQIPLH